MMQMVGDVTVCIAAIPSRVRLLKQALVSVANQTVTPTSIVVEMDVMKRGACDTKNRALAKVETQWVAWLDDDDMFMPQHLERLLIAANMYDTDVVYPWPEMIGGGDPRPECFGRPFDADDLRRRSYIPTTALFNAELARKVGGFQYPKQGERYDDWGLWLAMLDAGATFHHLAERTWYWRVEGQNTSGDPARW